jgi:hypothetical protein
MAATVSGGQTDSMFFGNWVGSSILDEMRPHNVIKPLLNREGRRPGLVFNFPIQDDPNAATANQAEGTAFTETVLATSSQAATARLNGQVATVTDMLDSISIVDAVSHFSQVLARSCAEEFEITAGAVFANSNGTIASSDLAGFYDAMADLEAKDATGEFVAVLKAGFVATLRTGLSTATGAFWGSTPGSSTADNAIAPQTDGSLGPISGVQTYLTTAAATSCMFVKGVAHGLYEIFDVKAESHRDIFQPGTQIAATTLYGVCTVRADWSTDI